MSSQWPSLPWHDRLAVALAMMLTALLALPHLPPGICMSDGGDLQVASVTLGIAHPPGYPAFTSFGFLLSRPPGMDPAYCVSLGCLGAGVVALWLCMLLQIRLGLNAWAAGATTILLSTMPRVWQNLIAPEIYAPSLALLAGSGYLLLKHIHTGRPREIHLAAGLFGILAANRPPALLILPFFALAGWITRESSRNVFLMRARQVFILAGFLLAPVLYSVGYVWVRDTSTAAYNYIEQHNQEFATLPSLELGPSAKWQRTAHHLSAAQYAPSPGADAVGLPSRLRWIFREIAPPGTPLRVFFITAVGIGFTLLCKRRRAAACILGGIVTGNVVFLCFYRIHGLAANLAPTLWALTPMVGAAVTPLFPRTPPPWRRRTAITLFVLAASWSILDAPDRTKSISSSDATGFLDRVDVPTLPANAILCTTWETYPPLWYACHVLNERPDVKIINARPENWLRMIRGYPDRPVFLTRPGHPLPTTLDANRSRTLWRLSRPRAHRGFEWVDPTRSKESGNGFVSDTPAKK